jgi:anti-anti-sigma regulatory factor
MAKVAEWRKMDVENIVSVLQEAARKVDSADGEVVLDFSAVRRIAPSTLRALEDLVNNADAKAVKVVLRGVSVDLYKVLKLVKLASRFAYVS